MKKELFLAAAILISGCASGPSDKAHEQSWSKSTLSIDCESKCSVSYTDPRDRIQAQENPWLSGFKVFVSAAFNPQLAMAGVAWKGLDALGSADRSITTINTDNRMENINNATDNSERFTSTEQLLFFKQGNEGADL